MSITEKKTKGPAVFGKQAVRKPFIYIASNYANPNRGSSLDIAEQVDQSPFIRGIFIAEGLFPLPDLVELSYAVALEVAPAMKSQRELADIFIIDRRYGDPAELGYAEAKGIPYVEFNPEGVRHNPCFTGGAVQEVSDIRELADINYLKVSST